ncbi:MAG TPA: MFS transporter, partial [Ramlibacter sp.]|nr:MFS transporter [Ramlibacter sp.]
IVAAQQATKVTVTADPAQCSFQGSPIARDIDFRSSCDIAKRALTQSYVPYQNVAGPAGSLATITVGDKVLNAPTGTLNEARNGFAPDSAKAIADFRKQLGDTSKAAGLTQPADPAKMNKAMVLAILVFLVILVTMVYGPIAAMLVELFPTRIRYTSMSLPYHIGNGWFGGLLPTTAFAMVAATGDIYYGLWYPVIVAAGTFIIGMIFIRETKDVDIYARD